MSGGQAGEGPLRPRGWGVTLGRGPWAAIGPAPRVDFRITSRPQPALPRPVLSAECGSLYLPLTHTCILLPTLEMRKLKARELS